MPLPSRRATTAGPGSHPLIETLRSCLPTGPPRFILSSGSIRTVMSCCRADADRPTGLTVSRGEAGKQAHRVSSATMSLTTSP